MLAFALLLAKPTLAQTVFAPHGAEWWYEERGIMPMPGGPFLDHAYVTGDTLLGGQRARCIALDMLMDTGGGYDVYSRYRAAYIVRTSADSVLCWDAPTGRYRLVANFAQGPGDTWAAPGCSGQLTATVVFDSVDQIGLGGRLLRRQHQHPSADPNNQLGLYALPFVERLGASSCLLFSGPVCMSDGGYYFLHAYRDSTFTYGTSPLGTPGALAAEALTVAPNPAADGHFRISGLTSGTTITGELYDAQGRALRAVRLSAAQPALDLASQPAGLYLLRATVAGRPFVRRLVRQ